MSDAALYHVIRWSVRFVPPWYPCDRLPVVSSSPRKTLWATASAPVSAGVDAGPWQEDARVASSMPADIREAVHSGSLL